MHFTFSKVNHFTRLVKAGDRLREFNFRELNGFSSACFHVDVADEKGDRLIFRLQQTEYGWTTDSVSLPHWVQEVLPKLGPLAMNE